MALVALEDHIDASKAGNVGKASLLRTSEFSTDGVSRAGVGNRALALSFKLPSHAGTMPRVFLVAIWV